MIYDLSMHSLRVHYEMPISELITEKALKLVLILITYIKGHKKPGTEFGCFFSVNERVENFVFSPQISGSFNIILNSEIIMHEPKGESVRNLKF